MKNVIDVLIGEPFVGETKFHVGDTLKYAKFPSGERFLVVSIEVQQLNPWHTCVVYELESNRHGRSCGYKEVVEAEGYFEVVESNMEMRKFFDLLVERVKTGKLTRLEA